MRIAVSYFSHETCTFCPKPTTIEDFERGGVLRGEQIFQNYRGVPSYINGFIKAAEEEDVELVGILVAAHSWGGSSGSWVTRDCFEKYSTEIVDGLKDAGKLDGCLLAFHGAMAVDGYLKPEAEVARRVRAAVGNIPIIVTLDSHANEDHELTDSVDGVFTLRTYPHVDPEEIGMKAAGCLFDTIRGDYKPTMAIRKPGVMSPSVFQGTDDYPVKDILERAQGWENKEKGLCVSVLFGFAYSDVPDAGATVIVVTNDNQELAESVAQDVSDYIWSLREPLNHTKLPKTKEGVAKAMKAVEEGRVPVIIADQSDRIGDGTHILQELLTQKASNFVVATIADDVVIKKIRERAKIGENVTINVGGYSCKDSGEPVTIDGTVEYLGGCEYVHNGPMLPGAKVRIGDIAVLEFGENNHLIISQTLQQLYDDAILSSVGIDTDSLEIIVIKSRVHFKAYFKDVAGAIIVVDTPGIGFSDLRQLKYVNVPNDIYPVGDKWRK